jgi:hypothetical protein
MKVTAPGRPADLSLGDIREVLTDLDVVRQALADASAWRAWKAEGAGCPDCQRFDPGRCADHAADDEMAAAYEALLRRLAAEGGPR